MKRKLIKQGANALTITLPKEWINAHELQQGNEVDLNMENEAVVIHTNKILNLIKTSMHLPEMNIYGYRHFLANAYRKGFDEIHITFDKKEQFADIQSIIEELLGFEIVQQDEKSLTIKSVALPDIREYPLLFKRNFHMIHTAFDYLSEDLAKGKFDSAKMLALQKNHLKVCNFCKRIIYTNPSRDKKESYIHYQLLVLNDHCLSQLKYVYFSLQTIKKPSQTLIKYFNDLKLFFKEVTTAIFKEEQNPLSQLINKKYELYETKKQIIKNAKKEELETVQEISILLRLVTDYVSTFSLLTFKEN